MFKELTYTNIDLSTNLTLNCYCKKFTRSDKHTFACDIEHANVINFSLLTNNLDLKNSLNVNLKKDDYNLSIKNAFNILNYKNSNIYEFNGSKSKRIDNKAYWLNKSRNFGYSVLMYAPFYIDSADSIPEKYIIKITFTNSRKNYTTVDKYIYIDIASTEKILYQYLYKYISGLNFKNSTLYLHGVSDNKCEYDLMGLNMQKGYIQTLSHIKESAETFYKNSKNHMIDLLGRNMKKHHMILHQIIPLAFSFNINDVLTDNEKLYFKNAKVKITGYYANNNNIQYYKYDITDYMNLFLFNDDSESYDNYIKFINNSRNYIYDDTVDEFIEVDDDDMCVIMKNVEELESYKNLVSMYRFNNKHASTIYDFANIGNVIFDLKKLPEVLSEDIEPYDGSAKYFQINIID